MQNKSLLRLLARNWLITKRCVSQTTTTFNSAPAVSPLSTDVSESQQKNNLKMKGWHIHSYGDIDELQCSDILKMPQIRNADECLVKVLTTSVNPIDVAMLGIDFLP